MYTTLKNFEKNPILNTWMHRIHEFFEVPASVYLNQMLKESLLQTIDMVTNLLDDSNIPSI